MHNLKEIRKNFSEFEKSLEKRSVNIDFSNLINHFLFPITSDQKSNSIQVYNNKCLSFLLKV